MRVAVLVGHSRGENRVVEYAGDGYSIAWKFAVIVWRPHTVFRTFTSLRCSCYTTSFSGALLIDAATVGFDIAIQVINTAAKDLDAGRER